MANDVSRVLKIGIPKGSLQEATFELFARAGFNMSVDARSYSPSIDDPQLQCILFRAQELSRYVEDGVVDLGLTGHDWICENGSEVVEICELTYSKTTRRPARWVLAVPAESNVKSPQDLAGGIIATELVNITRKYFHDRGIDVRVEFSWGATEVKARLVDGIVELTETGSSLRANNLRIVDDILYTTTRLIANKNSWQDHWKHKKIEALALLLTGAIEAAEKVGLKMNVPGDKLDEVLKLLPAEKSPTISPLAEAGWSAVEVILEESVERELVPKLKQAGASGIITYPLNKVIP